MLVPFTELPETARIWIYQANRPFTEAEALEVSEKTAAFLEQWTAHGASLKAGFELRYNRFIVLGLDQSLHGASGCSIDASVHFVQQLEQAYGVTLLDRMNVTFRQGEYIAYKPLADFRKLAKARSVGPQTVVFNNLVANKREYEEDWEIPASESWHNRFF
ncbi:ABC transporter ATPase [Robiginitalea sp. M366]|uniref:ABC transporter ATPase n=1 Tax=Robiginitalea aestuariiviva TaxID=3036903 RepID=UPI00240D4505|nr:ABC transporter ATPase [Robiginitalea aestuariiviva]MDG1572707.1 ABC transporter ATPase [Robiginitalea aestuariiviva]